MKIQVGYTVTIDKDFTKEGEKYRSKVVDLGEGYVMIDYPTNIETGKTAFFMDGTQFVISFTDKLEMSYAFKAEVRGRSLKGVPMLQVSYPGDEKLVKIQRREFVRINTALDVAVEKEGERVQLVAEDISAGGIALNIRHTTLLEKNDQISLFLVLPFANHEIVYIKAKGKVVRIWEEGGREIASVQFEEIDAADRQRIVRFSFERQLQMRNEK